ncbi:histone-like nucleoid-structuring protein Lsr2 [Actinomadura geliboluensis]|uniref:Lsr2 family protein n=1 Tax=Actinomadura geliboluensis TaxID=882440 RepID=A0A5S4H722_9ACTN|nr:Lsr2 family protein [Actinomadura geliboluensis]TMR40554.1 Lsr2 family protein [Actinomadura geliboluensis]
MAQKVQIIMTDDLDGGEADETVSFALDGKAYEIDLSEDNARRLRGMLHRYMDSGRRLKAARGGSLAARGTVDRERSAEIRQWAKVHGIKINERGRIPAAVIEQYQAAH